MLPYGRQTIDDEDIAAVIQALRAPMLTGGPLVARFEAELARTVQAPHAVACANGTAALHLAYAALGIGAGDEIITTPITFSATAAAAYYVGATVRIADTDPRTGNLDPASVAPLIGPRTRAIVPVHLGGMPADLGPLSALARQHGLRLIEDACHALGATSGGVPIGGAPESDAIVFSFHPVKHVTTGEGGAVIVRSADLARRVERLRGHGIEREPARLSAPAEGPWTYEVAELGWNYRLPDIACALGLSQLRKLPAFVARRRALADRYRAALAAAFGGDYGDQLASPIAAPAALPGRESAYHLFAIAVDWAAFGVTRADVVRALAADEIGTQVHYIPLLRHPLHAARCPGELARPRPGADHYYARTLSLPLFPAMRDDDVDRVVAALRRALTHATGGTSR